MFKQTPEKLKKTIQAQRTMNKKEGGIHITFVARVNDDGNRAGPSVCITYREYAFPNKKVRGYSSPSVSADVPERFCGFLFIQIGRTKSCFTPVLDVIR